MTAFRLGRVAVPRATEPSLAQPAVVARSLSPALALRLGLAGVAVASAVVGLVLFDEADPALWVPGYWPVRELLSALGQVIAVAPEHRLVVAIGSVPTNSMATGPDESVALGQRSDCAHARITLTLVLARIS